jgi:transcriptional regulator with XRE-family HTH domain
VAGRGDYAASGFGPALRREREAKGWTQKELADAAGTHGNTVARIERGENEPAWPLVLKFAAALGVSCEAFAGTGVSPPAPADRPASAKPAKRKGKK